MTNLREEYFSIEELSTSSRVYSILPEDFRSDIEILSHFHFHQLFQVEFHLVLHFCRWLKFFVTASLHFYRFDLARYSQSFSP